jgi:hypothetical protein
MIRIPEPPAPRVAVIREERGWIVINSLIKNI